MVKIIEFFEQCITKIEFLIIKDPLYTRSRIFFLKIYFKKCRVCHDMTTHCVPVFDKIIGYCDQFLHKNIKFFKFF